MQHLDSFATSSNMLENNEGFMWLKLTTEELLKLVLIVALRSGRDLKIGGIDAQNASTKLIEI